MAKNQKTVLRIVSYNDVYLLEPTLDEYGEERGGPSRAAHVLKTEIKSRYPDALVLFAGDTLAPSSASLLFQGQQMIDVHNELKCDFASLGNHEFDVSLPQLKAAFRNSHFPWLNANVYEKSTHQLLQGTIPNAIKRVQGIKVGFFGVVYPLENPELAVYFKNPIEAACEQVLALKARGEDFIIAMTHQRWADDNQFASQVEGIDFIVGGHDHQAMFQTQFKTPYVKSDSDLRSIWLTELRFNEYKRTSLKHENIPITNELEKDEAMEEIVVSYMTKVNAVFQQQVGKSCVDLDCRQSVVRIRSCDMGKLIADSQRSFIKSDPALRMKVHTSLDAAVMNGGGIRSGKVYPKGDVLYQHIIEWLPFGNTNVGIQINGRELVRFIEATSELSCSEGGVIEENGYLLHPSGFTYTFVCTSYRKGYVEKIEWDEPNSRIRSGKTSRTSQRHGSSRIRIHSSDVLKIAITDHLYSVYKHLFSSDHILYVPVKDTIPLAEYVKSRLERRGEFCPDMTSRRFELKSIPE